MNKNEVAIIDMIINNNSGLTLPEIVEATGKSKTTVYRNLTNLVTEKLLYREDNSYYMGSILLRWLNIGDVDYGFIKLIDPYLKELGEQVNETVHLVQLQNDMRAVYIRKIEGTGGIQIKSQIGDELPLYSTGAGKAILSILPDEEIIEYFKDRSKFVKNTKYTEIRQKILKEEVLLNRSRGYSVEIQQNEDKIQCVGVAFKYCNFTMAISISTTILTSLEQLTSMANILVETKNIIIHDLLD